MRLHRSLCALAALALAAGCGGRPEDGAFREPPGTGLPVRSQPLLTGKLERGTFWKQPLTAATNEGGEYASGSRVEVYDPFVVVTTPDGFSHVHPHGCYSGLVIKKD